MSAKTPYEIVDLSLPEGWKKFADPQRGHCYFYNSQDKTTHWKHPTTMMPELVPEKSKKSIKQKPPSKPSITVSEIQPVRRRGEYLCRVCGVPKQGHDCPGAGPHTSQRTQSTTKTNTTKTTPQSPQYGRTPESQPAPKRLKSAEKQATKKTKTEEKRSRTFRRKLSEKSRQRLERAESQRLYLVERKKIHELEQQFAVLGSTGNIYTVTIGREVDCTCPDSTKGNLCKHVLFVMLKVLRQPRHSELIYQTALLSTEIKKIFSSAPADPSARVLANATVRRTYSSLTGESSTDTIPLDRPEPGADGRQQSAFGIPRKPTDSDPCPVCYEDFTPSDDVVWCQKGCGGNCHRECFRKWAGAMRTRGEIANCVFCRAEWIDDRAPVQTQATARGSVDMDEGFVNMAALQGVSHVRDTSTYSDWHFRRRRMTDWDF